MEFRAAPVVVFIEHDVDEHWTHASQIPSFNIVADSLEEADRTVELVLRTAAAGREILKVSTNVVAV